MRLHQSLAGTWQFQVDPEGTLQVGNLAPERQIPVPMPWQAVFPDLEDYSGYGWYVRDVTLDAAWLTSTLQLTFGAVDYWCQVFINGQLAGQHEGGYTAFTLPIRPFVKAGSNQIAVRVYDSARKGSIMPRIYEGPDQPPARSEPPFDSTHIPHGKQEWYMNVGGIWQDVTLMAVPALHIDNVRISPDIHTGVASVTVWLGGDVQQAAGNLQVQIDSAGVTPVTVPLTPGSGEIDVEVTVPSPDLWSIETPRLYTATLSLTGPSGEDLLSTRFGFREISIHDGQLLLNGEPIFMLAALDQDMYPGTIYTIPSREFMRDQFIKAKQLGLNCVRCHIKPPDPVYLDLADELGLLVWAEIPSWRTFYVKSNLHYAHANVTDDIKARVRQTLQEMIVRDYNHPSLVVWSIVNEDWGTAVNLSSSDRAWLVEMYDWCKQLDPQRLVVDNSACLINLHVKSDLDDYHIYANIPDQAPFFEQFIERFCQRATWAYSSFGDAQRTGQEPLILSEFGNWGVPSINALRDASGNVPDWFKLGAWWSGWEGEPGWPRGAEERFKRFGLDAIWKDYESFAEATQWHQYQAMKYEIEVMRRQPALSGYVITELSDIYWESNGLMDFNRGKKAYHDVFGAINNPDVIAPRFPRYATWDDQPLPMRLSASHYGPADWDGAHVTWQVDQSGGASQSLEPLARGQVADLGLKQISFTPVAEASWQRVSLTVQSRDGKSLATNNQSILVLPSGARRAAYTGNLILPAQDDPFNTATTGSHPLAARLADLGYQTASDLSAEGLIVTDSPSAEVLKAVRDGRSLLYLSNGVGPFFWWQGRGGSYGGSWITAWSWLRPGIFRRLQSGETSNPLTLPYMSVMPSGVLVNLPVADPAFQLDFLAGQISGWVHHPAVHTVQFRYGKGKVLMTTYQLASAISSNSPDPVGVAMFHDLVDHLASEKCQPRLTANL